MVNPKIPASHDITRTTLAVLFIGILIAASFWVVLPFLTVVRLGHDDRRGHLAGPADSSRPGSGANADLPLR